MTDGISNNQPRITTNEAYDAHGYETKARMGGEVFVNIRHDGQIDDNIHYGMLSKEQKYAVKHALTPLAQAREELMGLIDAAKSAGDYQLASRLEKELGEVKEQMQLIKTFVEERNGLTRGIDLVNPGKQVSKRRFEQFDSGLEQITKASYNRADGWGLELRNEALDKLGLSANDFAAVVGMPEPAFAASPTGTTKSSSSEDGMPEWASALLADPDALVAEFENDPKGFFARVGDLNSGDRQALMMALQNEIQQDNQLFSTLTNFMKAMHDTEKGIIANLRV